MFIRVFALFLLLSSPAFAYSSDEIMVILEQNPTGEKPYKLLGQICLPGYDVQGTQFVESNSTKCMKKKDWNKLLDKFDKARAQEKEKEKEKEKKNSTSSADTSIEAMATIYMLYLLADHPVCQRVAGSQIRQIKTQVSEVRTALAKEMAKKGNISISEAEETLKSDATWDLAERKKNTGMFAIMESMLPVGSQLDQIQTCQTYGKTMQQTYDRVMPKKASSRF